MDESKIRESLVTMLTDVANQARADALAGQSNIGSIYDKDLPKLRTLDPKQIEEAIANIKKATATKESAARLINAILVAAKTVATIAIRPI